MFGEVYAPDYMFGEVSDPDPKRLSHFTTVAKLPAVLDFGFQGAVAQVLVHDKGTDVLAKLFSEDGLYGPGVADTLPTFLGNHDMGRFGHFLRAAHPDMSDAEMMKRTILGNALMFFARGVPVIYYGDEQGFVGDGGDQDAREDMFPSKVVSYNDNKLIGTDATTAVDNFNENHPLYRSLKAMAALYHANPALRQGKQKVLFSSPTPGLFVFSRTDKASGEAVLVAVNTAKTPMTYKSQTVLKPMTDGCVLTSGEGLTLAPLGYAVCRMENNN